MKDAGRQARAEGDVALGAAVFGRAEGRQTPVRGVQGSGAPRLRAPQGAALILTCQTSISSIWTEVGQGWGVRGAGSPAPRRVAPGPWDLHFSLEMLESLYRPAARLPRVIPVKGTNVSFAAQDAGGSFYCLRCYRSGFPSIDAVRGHRRSAACKAGLGGVRAGVERIAERKTSQTSSSLPAVAPAAQQLGASRISRGTWAPASLGQAARPLAQAQAVLVGSDGAAAGPCPGCTSLTVKVEQLEAHLRQVAAATSNHLEHAVLAQAQASTWPSPWLIVGGIATLGLIAWAAGLFDGAEIKPSMSGFGSEKAKRSRSGLSELLDVAGKGARLAKTFGIF